jgi:hypothetical protein
VELGLVGLLVGELTAEVQLMSCCCEKLVAEAGDSFGTHIGSRYRATASKDLTVNTSVRACVSVCKTVKCEV